MKIFNKSFDNVIKSEVGLGMCDYAFALEKFYPLINRFEAQRKSLDSRLYKRLEQDILAGCIMPPITIAFVKQDPKFQNIEELKDFMMNKINHGYILDGIQRLNTLKKASELRIFEPTNPIYFNVIISDNEDKLLYRMITLNNGQKPMTPKHQIEILTRDLFDFSHLTRFNIQSEKKNLSKDYQMLLVWLTLQKGIYLFLLKMFTMKTTKSLKKRWTKLLSEEFLSQEFLLVQLLLKIFFL